MTLYRLWLDRGDLRSELSSVGEENESCTPEDAIDLIARGDTVLVAAIDMPQMWTEYIWWHNNQQEDTTHGNCW